MPRMFKKLVLTLGAAVAMVAHAAEIEWMTDLEEAGKKAAQENKLLLVEFTGSDWCRYCILQKKNVLDKPAFAEWANKHCVAVEIDIPHDASRVGGEAKKEANKQICEDYAISSFPSLMLMTPERVLIGGYNGAQTTPQAAIAALEKHFPLAKELQTAMQQSGAERAVALNAIYSRLPEDIRKGNFRLMELIALDDPENLTGIQDTYRPIKQMRDLHAQLARTSGTEERLAILDAAYQKAAEQNKATIMRMKEIELNTAAHKLMRNPSSVEDIYKARDYFLLSAECSGTPGQKAKVEQYFAEPEKLYKEILKKRKK